jgi:hypothetical protein
VRFFIEAFDRKAEVMKRLQEPRIVLRGRPDEHVDVARESGRAVERHGWSPTIR